MFEKNKRHRIHAINVVYAQTEKHFAVVHVLFLHFVWIFLLYNIFVVVGNLAYDKKYLISTHQLSVSLTRPFLKIYFGKKLY